MTIPSAPERLYSFVVTLFPTGTPVPFPKRFQIRGSTQHYISTMWDFNGWIRSNIVCVLVKQIINHCNISEVHVPSASF